MRAGHCESVLIMGRAVVYSLRRCSFCVYEPGSSLRGRFFVARVFINPAVGCLISLFRKDSQAVALFLFRMQFRILERGKGELLQRDSRPSVSGGRRGSQSQPPRSSIPVRNAYVAC